MSLIKLILAVALVGAVCCEVSIGNQIRWPQCPEHWYLFDLLFQHGERNPKIDVEAEKVIMKHQEEIKRDIKKGDMKKLLGATRIPSPEGELYKGIGLFDVPPYVFECYFNLQIIGEKADVVYRWCIAEF